MKDYMTSLFDNYQGKIKNPFIGTIISVWLIHNWRIPYALFNFDKECTMQDKINFIADYFGKQNFWWELLDIIGISFLTLLITFLLLAISRIVTDCYYKIIEPFFITKIDKKEILTLAIKNALDIRIKELEDNLNGKREEITRVESNNLILTQKRDNLQKEYDSYVSRNVQENEFLKNEINELGRKENATTRVTRQYDNLITTLTSDEHKFLSKSINGNKTNESIASSQMLGDFLLKNGFITRRASEWKLNTSGEIFLNYYKEVALIEEN